jgi:hypothetical protein
MEKLDEFFEDKKIPGRTRLLTSESQDIVDDVRFEKIRKQSNLLMLSHFDVENLGAVKTAYQDYLVANDGNSQLQIIPEAFVQTSLSLLGDIEDGDHVYLGFFMSNYLSQNNILIKKFKMLSLFLSK